MFRIICDLHFNFWLEKHPDEGGFA